MRLFLDANILVSVLNKEYPLFTFSSRILSLAGHKNFELYTSPICLSIAFYFAEKKFRAVKAKEKIALLCDHITILETGAKAVRQTLQNKAIIDFEDGLEYYAAIDANCHCIITEDKADYHFSKIEVVGSEAFFEKYMMGKKR